MSPQIIWYFRLNGRFGCRTHLMIEKIVSENIAGAKKKPMRVDWLEQTVRGRVGMAKRLRRELLVEATTALGAYVWRLLTCVFVALE